MLVVHHLGRSQSDRIVTIHVNGPWAITFGWESGEATDVDLGQYH